MKISRRLFIYILLIIFGFAAMLLISNTLLLRPLYQWSVRSTMLSSIDDYTGIDYTAETDEWLDQVIELSSGKAYDVVVRSDDLTLFSSSKEAGIFSRPGAGGGPQEAQRHLQQSQVFFSRPENFEDLSERADGTKIGIMPFGDGQTELMVCTKQADENTTVFLTQPLAPLNQSVNQANILLLGCTVLFLIVLIFVVLRLSKRFTKPIREIQTTVGQIAGLNFKNKCDITTGDELQSLGEDVNLLADKLQTALEELKSKNEQLQKDIEAQKRFIANASHELRTPLSLIKGYSEEMSAGFVKDTKQTGEYAGIIADEATKMTRLLSEMLELSRMQSGQAKMQNEVLSVSEQIKSFLEKYDGFIDKNDLRVILDLNDDTEGFFDSIHFEQVLANYISNAARYGDDKKLIKISSKQIGENIRISVFNSGRHISADKLENIWDGFYKLDDARTRSQDSYGLGLSIVKAIQTAIGCGYGAKNVEGGVEFWFEVPRHLES